MGAIARRWGYDHDTQEFMLAVEDVVPPAEYEIIVTAESGVVSGHKQLSGGEEIRIPIRVGEIEGVGAKINLHGEEVDSCWVRTDRVTCPHCGKRIDQE